MLISDLSIKYNIPAAKIIDFFANHGEILTADNILSNTQLNFFELNLSIIKSSLNIYNVANEKLQGPKILGKIDLMQFEKLNSRKSDGLPSIRLMAAAKTFNLGTNTLIDFLVSKGINTDDLKPSAKLSPEMYQLLVDEFSGDREAKRKSDLIDIPKSTDINYPRIYKGKGIVKEISNDKIKIHFLIDDFSTNKKGRRIRIEKEDKNSWIIALKEFWPNVEFWIGKRIEFLIQDILKEGRKYRLAMPLDTKHNTLVSPTSVPQNFKDSISNKQPLKETVSADLNPISDQQSKSNKNINMKRISPLQKIIFGSPGTGKSHKIDGSEHSYLQQLEIVNKSVDCIKTVFHPEYTYGDFMGKLMPNTNDDGQVEYRFYAGHFLKALGKAYKNIIIAKIEHDKLKDDVERGYKREINKSIKKEFSDEEAAELQSRKDSIVAPTAQNVALVIDEINRGNSAAIFGTTFQLLDRDESGWSSYHVRISDLENNELLKEITLEYKEYKKNGKIEVKSYEFDGSSCSEVDYKKYLDFVFEDLPENGRISLTGRNIKIPPNLSIMATMNTSDNSIYFMDSAFKRRWDWEFIDITSDEQKNQQSGRKLEDGFSWDEFVDNLNSFIKKYGERIRKIEDKQIGYYYIKGKIITNDAIKNKLMFFLWDSIFNNDKKPLKELIGIDKTLVTFGDFIRHYDLFLTAIKSKTFLQNNVL